jgi:hypothetical protein
MRAELLRDLNLVPHDILPLVGIFPTAVVAVHLDFLGQQGERGISVRLSQQDAMFVTGIALVVDAVVLADYNPKIISRVFHRD